LYLGGLVRVRRQDLGRLRSFHRWKLWRFEGIRPVGDRSSGTWDQKSTSPQNS